MDRGSALPRSAPVHSIHSVTTALGKNIYPRFGELPNRGHHSTIFIGLLPLCSATLNMLLEVYSSS